VETVWVGSGQNKIQANHFQVGFGLGHKSTFDHSITTRLGLGQNDLELTCPNPTQEEIGLGLEIFWMSFQVPRMDDFPSQSMTLPEVNLSPLDIFHVSWCKY
jgi:hypothetical protein